MNLHEYQAKELLKAYGVPVPAGIVASTAKDADDAAATLGGSAWVVKAQVHAGGRGRAGGVKIVKSSKAAGEAATTMLGTRLVTAQTGAAGKEVKRVYIEQACDVAREIYLAAMIDRSLGRVAFLASSEGGEGIEEAATVNPDKINKLVVDPNVGLVPTDAEALIKNLGLSGGQATAAATAMQAIYKAFTESDASLIEINPLAVTDDGDLFALDVKMIIDDNAVYRHPEFEKLWDEAEVSADEIEARRHELNYIHMDGNIGVMVSGAGLAMGILDLLKAHGGEAADFMDVRPVATRDQIAAGIRMLLGDAKVKALLVVAMGGGVLRCDTIAEGIAIACKEAGSHAPVIVRFAGTAKELGELALQNQAVGVTFASDLSDAAAKAVAVADGGG
ncbi:MAG: ADP-forming succinate--CoA ligase subunit beta [Alphaproteobacteria bacterium]|jgi:succinyl-CoA synthetase beta subunit|nr:ADP-forming succinate--CoA ligase subunit beta [Alphaproteobacteria bacterium]MBT7943652.1 ADP-forming succinate--CoA ligase subunit beta [Alphaproteobacteria bacterium]